MEQLSEILKFLDEYPLEEKPYPPGYPDDLKFDLYPGKDYVIGACDEAIETSLKLYPEAKNKEIMKLYIKIMQTVREIRIRRLYKHKHPHVEKPPSFEQMVKEALF